MSLDSLGGFGVQLITLVGKSEIGMRWRRRG